MKYQNQAAKILVFTAVSIHQRNISQASTEVEPSLFGIFRHFGVKKKFGVLKFCVWLEEEREKFALKERNHFGQTPLPHHPLANRGDSFNNTSHIYSNVSLQAGCPQELRSIHDYFRKALTTSSVFFASTGPPSSCTTGNIPFVA